MRPAGRAVASVLLVVTFVVGALAGMAAEEGFGWDWFDFFEEQERPDQLLAGLDLSPQQRRDAEAVLERQEDALEEYWEARLPEIQGMVRQSYDDIRALLTPTQRAAFDERVRGLNGRVPAELRDD